MESIEIGNQDIDVIEKFETAIDDTSSYRNCAGFTKYMLGLDTKETLISPDVLATELIPLNSIDLDKDEPEKLDSKIYLENAKLADAIALKVNLLKNPNPKTLSEIVNSTKSGEKYVHFAYIDPNDINMIFQRPDLELKPEHIKWIHIFDDLEEFSGMDKKLVFFKK